MVRRIHTIYQVAGLDVLYIQSYILVDPIYLLNVSLLLRARKNKTCVWRCGNFPFLFSYGYVCVVCTRKSKMYPW